MIRSRSSSFIKFFPFQIFDRFPVVRFMSDRPKKLDIKWTIVLAFQINLELMHLVSIAQSSPIAYSRGYIIIFHLPHLPPI
jgi:hypothetical protein